MSSVAAIFFLLCCSSSLHACNARIRRGIDFDHMQDLDSKSLTLTMESNLQGSEAAVSSLTNSTIATEHMISSSWETIGHGDGRSHEDMEIVNDSIVEKRILQEQDAAAQEYNPNDSNDVAEDAVVMDYAQPHRKPPIHNEEN